MKVCYITQSNLALTRSHVRSVLKTAEALNTLPDVQVSILTRSHLSKSVETIFQEKDITPLPIDVFQGSYIAFALFVFKKAKQFDVVYFRDHKLSPIVFVARFILRKKVVFEAHRLAEKWFEPVLWWLSTVSAHGVIGISKILLQKLKLPSSKPTVVGHCGVTEYHLFNYSVTKDELRKQLRLPQDGFLIGYAGQLRAYNLHPVFKAVAQLRENYSIRMYIVGAKPAEIKPLQQQIASHDLSDEILVRERILHKHVMDYYLAADCLIVPFGGDGPGDLPTKCYEYMATKRPIIAERNQATVEILHHEKNALLVDALDSEDWESAFKRVMGDINLVEQITNQAFADGKYYTWEQRAKDINSVLSQI